MLVETKRHEYKRITESEVSRIPEQLGIYGISRFVLDLEEQDTCNILACIESVRPITEIYVKLRHLKQKKLK